ncbi:interleukin 15 receptor subunit alpha [Rhinolophus ferrumequinum]|uniref:Interleukin 15 receptor subunit alpha n=1 Tax=Rhinolophus ferrumequinum TaxID=59479 RepID=A0A7J7ZC59_RHIFE|nr:interleukin 15 receptor subunit alpha [Rhinolophus ferrumequinum]
MYLYCRKPDVSVLNFYVYFLFISSPEATPRSHPQDDKCHVVVLSLGDPSLTHQTTPSTVATAGVTPEPESPSPPGKGTYSYDYSRTVAVSVSIPVAVLCGVCVVFLVAHYVKSRQTPRTPSVEMENTEDMPMTGGTSGRQDTENYPMA